MHAIINIVHLKLDFTEEGTQLATCEVSTISIQEAGVDNDMFLPSKHTRIVSTPYYFARPI